MRLLLGFVFAFALCAESGYDAWLRYPPLSNPPALPGNVTLLGDSPVLRSAHGELLRAVRGMTGRLLRDESKLTAEDAIVLGKLADLRALKLPVAESLPPESFQLKRVQHRVIVAGPDDRGVLYGTFALLRMIAMGEPIANLDRTETPYAPIRWLNHWDNLNGTIERGYGGKSIFWDDLHSRADLSRVADYGRLLASLGVNGCSIDNVNVNPRVMAAGFLPEIARIAEAFRPWGVRVVLAVDFSGPKAIGGLDTFDPIEPKVAKWWKDKADEMYRAVPDLAGFVMKADSEGRLGPSAYGRSHADAANVVARALKPHGGLVFYRGFVYDHRMDWRNPKNDRARAADDNFRSLDGQFDDNAVIQIKHGPIDFQVREPASPLFGTLEKTNQAIELQITQEYFGQAKHTVFLAPMWKAALDFDLEAGRSGTPVKALAAGKVFRRPVGGMVGVSNVGLDENWLGNHLSQANLYAFGRLAWNADLSPERISQEWTRLTFGPDPRVNAAVNAIQLSSWKTYENYTGPLGLQTLTDIVGNHYGVSVEASEGNGWGQWHRADDKGVGMDRSSAAGTGYAGQYRPGVARVYESPDRCPDDLLLFFHHVPYTHRLHSGKTVAQSIYDSHYEGAAAVEGYVRQWRTLAGLVDERRYREVLAQLEYQAGQAEVWRDAVAGWFFKASGIPDGHGRVGHYPGRVEAESMTLQGYQPVKVNPAESASGGTAVECKSARCSAEFAFDGAPGWYSLRVRYFDLDNGVATFAVLVNEQRAGEWSAPNRIPTKKLDGSSSSLRVIELVKLKTGDKIRIEGVPDKSDPAALDYVEWRRERDSNPR